VHIPTPVGTDNGGGQVSIADELSCTTNGQLIVATFFMLIHTCKVDEMRPCPVQNSGTKHGYFTVPGQLSVLDGLNESGIVASHDALVIKVIWLGQDNTGGV
jgi:hypothetical protein